jgi:hypothetical protein
MEVTSQGQTSQEEMRCVSGPGLCPYTLPKVTIHSPPLIGK